MNVLVLCQFPGIVREAFRVQGHEAVSCDLLPTEQSGLHLQMDARTLSDYCWRTADLVIAHPPCTHLAVSGARYFARKQSEQAEALAFVRWILELPVPRICVENPVSIISSRIRKPDQIIQPWQFGHAETKATCLWLKGLPRLTPTEIVTGREERCWRMAPSPDRWKNRSRTYIGIAQAMASQWGEW